LLIDTVKKTLGIGQIINRIQDVGFAAAIGSGDAIDTVAKLQVLFFVVLEIKELQPADVHATKLVFLVGYRRMNSPQLSKSSIENVGYMPITISFVYPTVRTTYRFIDCGGRGRWLFRRHSCQNGKAGQKGAHH
jgi:hypothetical protein